MIFSECIIDAMGTWRRHGLQGPFEIVVSQAFYRNIEAELGDLLLASTALTGDAIIIQTPAGPVRITKEKAKE